MVNFVSFPLKGEGKGRGSLCTIPIAFSPALPYNSTITRKEKPKMMVRNAMMTCLSMCCMGMVCCACFDRHTASHTA